MLKKEFGQCRKEPLRDYNTRRAGTQEGIGVPFSERLGKMLADAQRFEVISSLRRSH